MRHRGLTLIELLVAVSLLSSVVLAATSWIQIASIAGADALEAARWRNAADAVLELIHDDLMSGDFNSTNQKEANQHGKEVRCQIIDGVLVIRTRGIQGFESAHRYRLDLMENRLELNAASDSGPGEPEISRSLLGDVEAFIVRITEDEPRLDVTIASDSEERVTRSYWLP